MDNIFNPRILNSASVNKHVRSVFRNNDRFNTLEKNRWNSIRTNRSINRIKMAQSLILDSASIGLRGIGGIGVTAMAIGMYGVQSSFDRSMNQSLVSNALDLFVSEAPQIASFAVFGAAEKLFTGKLGEGAAGGFFRRAFGVRGGGIAGKGAAFAGSIATAMLSIELLKPLQQKLSGAIASERSSGLMSAIAKGSQAEIEAELLKSGINVNGIPKSIAQMTNKQLLQAQSELRGSIHDGGFWSALGSGKLIKWSEQRKNEDAQSQIRSSITEAGVNLYTAMDENNRMIIEYYSRE